MQLNHIRHDDMNNFGGSNISFRSTGTIFTFIVIVRHQGRCELLQLDHF